VGIAFAFASEFYDKLLVQGFPFFRGQRLFKHEKGLKSVSGMRYDGMNSDKIKETYLRKSVFFRVFASNVQIQVYAEDGGNVVLAVLVGYTGVGSGIYAEINVGGTSFGVVKGKIPKKRFSPNFREKAFRDVSVIEGYRLDFFLSLSFHGRKVFYYSEV
jgi:hypothetical protein